MFFRYCNQLIVVSLHLSVWIDSWECIALVNLIHTTSVCSTSLCSRVSVHHLLFHRPTHWMGGRIYFRGCTVLYQVSLTPSHKTHTHHNHRTCIQYPNMPFEFKAPLLCMSPWLQRALILKQEFVLYQFERLKWSKSSFKCHATPESMLGSRSIRSNIAWP